MKNSACSQTHWRLRDGFKIVRRSAVPGPRPGEFFVSRDAPDAIVWVAAKPFDIVSGWYHIVERERWPDGR